MEPRFWHWNPSGEEALHQVKKSSPERSLCAYFFWLYSRLRPSKCDLQSAGSDRGGVAAVMGKEGKSWMITWVGCLLLVELQALNLYGKRRLHQGKRRSGLGSVKSWSSASSLQQSWRP